MSGNFFRTLADFFALPNKSTEDLTEELQGKMMDLQTVRRFG